MRLSAVCVCTLLAACTAGPQTSSRSTVRNVADAAKACAAGEGEACVTAGLAYRYGRSVTRDPARAQILLRRACDAHSYEGCAYLGEMLARGEAGEKDPAHAIEQFHEACDHGELRGCADLGAAYLAGRGVEKDIARGM